MRKRFNHFHLELVPILIFMRAGTSFITLAFGSQAISDGIEPRRSGEFVCRETPRGENRVFAANTGWRVDSRLSWPN